jgi:glycosyltransferase involved in cell wall biosynthesis
MPNVLLEGMSRGLIPIATTVGAVEELVNGLNGFLLEPKNVTSIQETVERALSLATPELDILSSEAIRTIRSSFTWSHIISQTIEKFQRVIEKS